MQIELFQEISKFLDFKKIKINVFILNKYFNFTNGCINTKI